MVVAQGFSTNVIGFQLMQKTINDLPKSTQRVWRKEAVKHVRMVLKDAKANAPVRTGHLRSQIVVVENLESTNEFGIVAAADYSGFVEYGTSKMQAQPFIRPAIARYADALTSDFVNGLIDEVERGRL